MPGRVRLTAHEARALIAGRGVAHPQVRHAVKSAAHFRCHYCGTISYTLAGAERHADNERHRWIEVVCE